MDYDNQPNDFQTAIDDSGGLGNNQHIELSKSSEQIANLVKALKNLFNNLDTVKLVEKSGEINNANEIKENNEEGFAVKGAELWKVWLPVFSSYNALAVSILIQDAKKGKNRIEQLKSYRSLFKVLAYHGLICKSSRAIFIIGSFLLTVSILAAMLIAIKRNKNTLDFLVNRKFLLSITIISLILFASLITCAIWKVCLENRINDEKSDVHIKITKNRVGRDIGLEVDIAIDPQNENILVRDNNDNSQQTVHKAKFCEDFPSNRLPDDHYHINDRIPLYQSGYCSKSGSYKFFYFSTILMSLGIGLIALTTLYSQRNEKIAELTQNFLQEPKNIAYSMLSCILAFLVLYCAVRYGKHFFDGLYRVIKCVLTKLVDLAVYLAKQFWKFVCWFCRGAREIGGKLAIIINAGSDVTVLPPDILTTTSRAANINGIETLFKNPNGLQS